MEKTYGKAELFCLMLERFMKKMQLIFSLILCKTIRNINRL